MSQLVNKKSNLTVLSSFGYTTDAAGNRLRMLQGDKGTYTDYFYDNVYQLTRETKRTIVGQPDPYGAPVDDPVVYDYSYTFDNVGNRLTKKDEVTQVVTNYSYNTMNEMLTAGNASYIYDANGNTVSQTVGGQTTTYQYNFDNKLTQINFPGGGGSNTFVYNGEGVRVQKADSGGTVKFVYDGANVIGELDNANALVTAYTHGVGGLVSLRRAAGPSYYHFDGLGSTRELTAAAQNVTDTYDYEAYGIPTGQTGSTVNPYRYV